MMRNSMSAHQGKGCLQCLLLQLSPLAKPRRIESGIVATRLLVVIHVFGDRIEQAPSGVFGSVEVGTAAFTVVELLHLVECPVIGQLGGIVYRLIGYRRAPTGNTAEPRGGRSYVPLMLSC